MQVPDSGTVSFCWLIFGWLPSCLGPAVRNTFGFVAYKHKQLKMYLDKYELKPKYTSRHYFSGISFVYLRSKAVGNVCKGFLSLTVFI